MSMPFYVSPEQLMKDRADFARKGIARGRSVVVVQYADGVLFVAENPSQALHKVCEIYDRIAFAAVGPLQRVREPAHRRGPPRRHARLLLRPARRHRPRPGQRLRPDPRHDLLQRRREALRGGDLRRRGRRRAPRTTRSTGSPTTARSPTSTGYAVMGGAGRRRGGVPRGALRRGRLARATPLRARRRRPRATRERAGDRVIPAERPRGRGPRPHPQPAAQVRPADAGPPRPAARRARPHRAQPGVRGRAHGRPGRRAGEPAVPVARRRVRRRASHRPSWLSFGVVPALWRRCNAPKRPGYPVEPGITAPVTPPGRRPGTWGAGRRRGRARGRGRRRGACPGSRGTRAR